MTSDHSGGLRGETVLWDRALALWDWVLSLGRPAGAGELSLGVWAPPPPPLTRQNSAQALSQAQRGPPKARARSDLGRRVPAPSESLAPRFLWDPPPLASLRGHCGGRACRHATSLAASSELPLSPAGCLGSSAGSTFCQCWPRGLELPGPPPSCPQASPLSLPHATLLTLAPHPSACHLCSSWPSAGTAPTVTSPGAPESPPWAGAALGPLFPHTAIPVGSSGLPNSAAAQEGQLR